MSLQPRRGSFLGLLTTSLMVVTVLGAPALSNGRFVCVRGMTEAGASCPLCHDDSRTPTNPCCKWVESASPSAVHVAGPSVDAPTSASYALGAQPMLSSIELSRAAGWMNITASPPGGPPSRSTILRL